MTKSRKFIIAFLLAMLFTLGILAILRFGSSRTKSITRSGSIKINEKLRP